MSTTEQPGYVEVVATPLWTNGSDVDRSYGAKKG